jgi:hypothetical protein
LDLLVELRTSYRSAASNPTTRVGGRGWAVALGVLGLLIASLGIIVASAPARAAADSSPTPPTTLSPAQSAQRAAAQRVVTFGAQTASATATDSRDYYNYSSGAGGRLFDHIALLNYSTQTITLLVRPTDMINTPQGGLAAVPIFQRSHDVGNWIIIPPQYASITLGPREHRIIPFSVDVPKSATPGDHAGAITVTLQSTVISKSGQKVHLDQTTGTRMFIRVSGPLHPLLKVEDLRVHYAGSLNPFTRGKANLTYVIKNVGNVALGAQQTVYVSGLFGSKETAKHVALVPLLLPGYSIPEKTVVSGVLPEFLDTAHVRVNLLYIPGSVQPPSGPFYGSVQFLAIPWVLVAIVVVLIAIIIYLLLRRRRRKSGAGSAATISDSPKPTGTTKKRAPNANENDGEPVPVASSDSGNGKVQEPDEETV